MPTPRKTGSWVLEYTAGGNVNWKRKSVQPSQRVACSAIQSRTFAPAPRPGIPFKQMTRGTQSCRKADHGSVIYHNENQENLHVQQ